METSDINEEDEADEDDEGYDYNEEEEQSTEGISKRKSRATKPKDTSAVGQYLSQFNRKANNKKSALHQQIVGGQHWLGQPGRCREPYCKALVSEEHIGLHLAALRPIWNTVRYQEYQMPQV